MAPYTNIPLSAAELSYLHTSLTHDPPLRPDGRAYNDFRPLVAETDIVSSANGSARLCFTDGTEAIVGIKAEVEKTQGAQPHEERSEQSLSDVEMSNVAEDGAGRRGDEDWLEISIEIPGVRDDDALPAFLSSMLSEALLADGTLQDRLWINRRFHWRLYIDILLLSPPLSYPLPLLSLSTHLALLTTRLPALVSEHDEDPFFNDDWAASVPLYPPTSKTSPPITLLIMTVRSPIDPTRTTILFDPTREELAVADSVLAVSLSPASPSKITDGGEGSLSLLAIRTIDPPSRLTGAGIPQAANTTAGGGLDAAATRALREKDAGRTVWRPARGGVGRDIILRVVKECVKKGGVGQEVLAAAAVAAAAT